MNSTNFSIAIEKVEEYEIGGIPFLMNNLKDYLPYIIFTSIGTICGIFGNLLIMGAIICNHELQTVTNALIFNLAFSDFFIAAVSNSFTTIGVLLGRDYFDERPFLCRVIAVLCVTTCMCSLISMLLLAVNRFILIVYNHLYRILFCKSLMVIYIAFSWLAGLIVNVAATYFLGWEFNKYDTKYLSCHWNRLLNESFNIIIVTISIVIPCILILICYIWIFVYAKKVRSKTQSLSSKKEFMFSIRIAKGLFGSYILFAICWMPYAVITIYDFSDSLDRSVYIYSMLIMILNSSLNPIFYGLTNPQFQKGYKKLFYIMGCDSSSNYQASSATNSNASIIKNMRSVKKY